MKFAVIMLEFYVVILLPACIWIRHMEKQDKKNENKCKNRRIRRKKLTQKQENVIRVMEDDVF